MTNNKAEKWSEERGIKPEENFSATIVIIQSTLKRINIYNIIFNPQNGGICSALCF